MKATLNLVFGVVATLLLAFGLFHVAEKFDPTANVDPGQKGGTMTTAGGCVTGCSLMRSV